jgi:hypothetical protein
MVLIAWVVCHYITLVLVMAREIHPCGRVVRVLGNILPQEIFLPVLVRYPMD